MNTKQGLYDFLDSRLIAVLSTLSKENTPQSAVIGFGQTPELELIFGTDNQSRKYSNLKRNPRVSLVIGWDNNQTVQYEGIARELATKEFELVSEFYWSKNPGAKAYHKQPTERYFIVTPKWLRYTDLRTDPWTVYEIEF